jgi:hypothetical protein
VKRPRGLLGRLLFASVIAVLMIGGTLAGGAAYGSVHPTYDRIAWLERDPAQPDLPPVVRRALFSDGRYLALSSSGYRAGVLDQSTTDLIFSTASVEGPSWHSTYSATAVTGEVVDLEFLGHTPRTIRVANPETNASIPDALARVVQLLAAAERPVASVPFAAAAIRFWSTPMGNPSGVPIDALPAGFPIEQAAGQNGLVIGGADLELLRAVWPDLDSRFVPGLAQRFVKVGNAVWRVAWTLDLDSVGALASKPAGQAQP